MRMSLQGGRVSYEPSALDGDGPRESRTGYRSHAERMEGDKLRIRPESFADHYSQARQFFVSQTGPEQDHIVAAITFELSKVDTPAVRERVLGRLANIDAGLAARIAEGLGWRDPVEPAAPAVPVRTDLPPSPALSILAKAVPTLEGRTVGCLVSEGADAGVLAALRREVASAGAMLKLVCPRIGGVVGSDGKPVGADFQLAGGPSVLFDAVAVVVSEKGAGELAREAAARAFLADAFAHLKVIGHTAAAVPLLEAAGLTPGVDAGVLALDAASAAGLVTAAKGGRIWSREPTVRHVY